MYIDWVITLSIIIILLTCVFLGFGVVYSMKKIDQASQAHHASIEKTVSTRP